MSSASVLVLACQCMARADLKDAMAMRPVRVTHGPSSTTTELCVSRLIDHGWGSEFDPTSRSETIVDLISTSRPGMVLSDDGARPLDSLFSAIRGYICIQFHGEI